MTFIRNGRQAATTFDLGGAQAPRPKGLFFVRFKRGDGVQSESYWQKDLSFLVKSMDQPKIQPKVEEINQYNRKRQIYTGYQTQPVNVTFYDTADGLATRMWDEYSRYHFADFNQEVANFAYDVVSFDSSMLGGDIGYGYSPARDLPEELDVNSQFFFTTIEIFQVFRNAFTRVYLVNPKITAFDPEDLDYENMNVMSIRVTLAYEAVIYDNGGAPQPIDSDPALAEAFADVRLHGDIVEVSGVPGQPITQTSPPMGGGSGGFGGGLGDFFGGSGISGALSNLGGLLGGRGPSSGIGGVLGSFGNFNFGNAAGAVANSLINGRGINGAEIAYSLTGNQTLATIAGIAQNGVNRNSIMNQVAAGLGGGLSGPLVDAARGAIAAAGGDRYTAGAMAQSVLQGVLSAGQQGGSPRDHVSSQGGLSLSPTAYNAVNSVRSAASQIGRRIEGVAGQTPPPPAPPAPGVTIPPL